ncbi:acylglycerophosphoethanolamine acyltransferase [Penicillium coprophilum]|uniref:acylglycerophosphoethanolamine acyltransferase n=1 Tax=Penicillium coprophilum TaxID=36646 RepID=UPI00239E0F2E|nr:acylglycerophosphoethanolamine acyltransferase [Penicillium coprophilum]KAJ5170455.1 acylglycerophosphoethanolamine acyltransferase [Penicillium coprophilum]
MLIQSENPPFRRPILDLSIATLNEECDDASNEASGICSLPELIDFNATHNPHHLFCLQEERENGEHSNLTPLTFLGVQKAIYAAAASLRKITSPSLKTSQQPVALLLESDVTLFMYMSALLYMDIPVLLLSIRLSPVATAHLLQETSARALIVSHRTSHAGNQALDLLPTAGPRLPLISAISYKNLITSGEEVAVPPTTSRTGSSRARDEMMVILHSSGTTGLPKTIRLSQRYPLTYAACHLLAPEECVNRVNLSTLPLYHGFGLLAPCLSLSTGKSCCFPSSAIIPSATSVTELLERSAAASLMTVPIILEEMIESSQSIEILKPLDFVAVGGGAIKRNVGELLAANGVRLLNHYGATEIGPIAPIFIPSVDYDWNYLRIRTDLGLRVVDLEFDQSAAEAPRCQLIGFPLGWQQPYNVPDLLEKRAGSTFLEVRILGRNDDLIVLSTGEKVRPGKLENALRATDLIQTAIVFGEHREEIGVLVEPRQAIPSQDLSQFLATIWSLVEAQNCNLDRHARVSSMDMIIVKPEGKQMPLSDKGSVMRKEAYERFQTEIDAVYSQRTGNGSSITLLSPEPGKLEADLRVLVERCVHDRIAGRPWTNQHDFFELGMDSLEASRLAQLLNRVQDKSAFAVLRDGPVRPSFIYQHPSVVDLAAALQLGECGGENVNRVHAMTDLVSRFSPSSSTTSDRVVLITGSTGSLGVHLLQELCRDVSVNQVICLMRRAHGDQNADDLDDLRARQERANSAKGVHLTDEGSAKITFHEAQLDDHTLGLDGETYAQLTGTVTDVLHNAWPVNFQRTLHSLEPQIQTVKNLIHFSIQCQRDRSHLTPRLIFISSIAVGARFPSTVLPEILITDPTSTAALGYAEAKWVCERIIAESLAVFPGRLQPSIVRLGQITGATEGARWNQNEHIPAILKASQIVGAMPEINGTYSWIPVDIAAKAIRDILTTLQPTNLVYHVENPVRQPWKALLTVLARQLNLSSLVTIPLDLWLRKVESQNNLLSELEDFLRGEFLRLAGGRLILDTTQARKVSYTLRTCNGVTPDLVCKYIEVWQKEGFLH